MPSADEFAEVSRLLLIVAEDLEARFIPTAGVVRRGARLLAQATAGQRSTVHVRRCPVCGDILEPARRGRPKEYCSTRCKDAARYSRNAEG